METTKTECEYCREVDEEEFMRRVGDLMICQDCWEQYN